MKSVISFCLLLLLAGCDPWIPNQGEMPRYLHGNFIHSNKKGPLTFRYKRPYGYINVRDVVVYKMPNAQKQLKKENIVWHLQRKDLEAMYTKHYRPKEFVYGQKIREMKTLTKPQELLKGTRYAFVVGSADPLSPLYRHNFVY